MTQIYNQQNIKVSKRLDNVLDIIRGVLDKFGYLNLSLPMYEYYDLLADTVFNFSDDSAIRFIDRHTGKTLVLRPDFTPQVCRIISNMDNLVLPIRICYYGSVFRSVEKDKGIKGEENQAGWEIFGEESIYSDIEIVLVAYNIFQAIKLDNFIFAFSDSLFLNRIKEIIGDHADVILNIISDRRLHDLKDILSGMNIDDDIKNLLLNLPLAFGEIENIDKLITLSSFDNILQERLHFIKDLFNKLIECGIEKRHIIFDMAEAKGKDYYSGIHFDILHKDYGNILGSGGRYDKLMAKFGKDMPACGIALNIDNLLDFPICDSFALEYDYLVIGENNFQKAIDLRKQGFQVIFLADISKKEQFLENYTFKNIIGG